MTPSIRSQSFKSVPSPVAIDETVREVVAAMPIVIFANAIRGALLRRSTTKRAPVATRTFRTR